MAKILEHYDFSVDPGYDAKAVTTSDTVDIVNGAGDTEAARALYVGGGGDLVVIMKSGYTATFYNVPSGAIMPIQCKRVKLATTCTQIVALF